MPFYSCQQLNAIENRCKTTKKPDFSMKSGRKPINMSANSY